MYPIPGKTKCAARICNQSNGSLDNALRPVAQSSTTMSVCSTEYMRETLSHFTKHEMRQWFEQVQAIDAVIADDIEQNYPLIEKNNTKLPPGLIKSLTDKLHFAGVDTNYDLGNMEVFHGYIYYVSPDNGRKVSQTTNCDLNYGIAKATIQGLPHRHFESPAFNYILAGEGIFTGDPLEDGMFASFYHGQRLVADVALEIPLGMTHGHLVRKGSTLWLMAVQECSFAPDKGCAGDFHVLPHYDTRIFGPGYQ